MELQPSGAGWDWRESSGSEPEIVGLRASFAPVSAPNLTRLGSRFLKRHFAPVGAYEQSIRPPREEAYVGNRAQSTRDFWRLSFS
jgi:hypothetical protein